MAEGAGTSRGERSYSPTPLPSADQTGYSQYLTAAELLSAPPLDLLATPVPLGEVMEADLLLLPTQAATLLGIGS